MKKKEYLKPTSKTVSLYMGGYIMDQSTESIPVNSEEVGDPLGKEDPFGW